MRKKEKKGERKEINNLIFRRSRILVPNKHPSSRDERYIKYVSHTRIRAFTPLHQAAISLAAKKCLMSTRSV